MEYALVYNKCIYFSIDDPPRHVKEMFIPSKKLAITTFNGVHIRAAQTPDITALSAYNSNEMDVPISVQLADRIEQYYKESGQLIQDLRSVLD